MNLEDKNLSFQSYNFLCDIVGSDEVVRARREIFTAKDIVERPVTFIVIRSGSKAEGLDLKGSDNDQMCLLNFICAYENFKDIQYTPYKILSVWKRKTQNQNVQN